MQRHEASNYHLFGDAVERNNIFTEISLGKFQKIPPSQPIEALIAKGNFVAAIDELYLQNDLAHGVSSTYLLLNDYLNVKVLHRNAKEQTPSQAAAKTFHNWAILGLNYVKAAQSLLLSYGIKLSNEQQKLLVNQASEFYRHISLNCQDPEIEVARFLNSAIVPFIKKNIGIKISVKVIAKQLAQIRDFGNFDHDTLCVATVTNIDVDQAFSSRVGDRDKLDVLQIDVPMCGNFEEGLKKEFETLARYHLARTNEDEKALADIRWFHTLPSHVKYQVLAHAQDILNGKIIPTQLREYLPGIRNAGEERLYDASNQTLILSGFHSGTPGHLLKKSEHSLRATEQSVHQLQRMTGNAPLTIHTLLSPVNRASSTDAQLATQIATACEGAGTLAHSNTPFNNFRSAGFNFVTAVVNRLFGRKMQQNFKVAVGEGSLIQLAAMTVSTARVDSYRDESSEAALKNLEAAIKIYHDVESGSGLVDPENKNLQLVSAGKLVAHYHNQLQARREVLNPIDAVLSPDNFKPINQSDSCVSGKDRAAIARIKSNSDALMMYVTGSITATTDKQLLQEQQMLQKMTQSGQARLQAGLQGGTMGACGVKKDSNGAIPKSWQKLGDAAPITEQTASYNKKLPKNPDKHKPFYKQGKFWLGMAGLMIGAALCATGIGAIVGAPLIGAVLTTVVSAIGAGLAQGVVAASIVVGTGLAITSGVQLKKASSENVIARRVKSIGTNDYDKSSLFSSSHDDNLKRPLLNDNPQSRISRDSSAKIISGLDHITSALPTASAAVTDNLSHADRPASPQGRRSNSLEDESKAEKSKPLMANQSAPRSRRI
jgi:hypothetical protein